MTDTGTGGVSTHVLDTAAGHPAGGVAVTLGRATADGGWEPLGAATTDDDGRAALLPPGAPLTAGAHRVTFDTGAYFAARGVTGFYPEVAVVFTVADPAARHHVPLLLSPYGYATYRGS